MADIQVGNLLKLEIDGVAEALMFHKFDPPTLTLENITHNTWDDTGNLLAHSGGAKNPLSGEWGIERAVDDQGALFQWFKDTHDKGGPIPTPRRTARSTTSTSTVRSSRHGRSRRPRSSAIRPRASTRTPTRC